MIITTWNVRGLNSSGKERYMKDKLKVYKPNIMVSQETKIAETKLEEILKSYKPHYEVVAQDVRGSARGLTILLNLAKIIFDDWVSLPRILIGEIHHMAQEIGSY